MAKVKNWQLGREMDFPYPEHRPKKQIAYVFDTNKCIACQTCTMACKTTWTVGKGQEYVFWNNVESKPWGYYPLGWDVKVLELLGQQKWDGDKYAGKTIFEAAPKGEPALGYAPEDLDYASPNLGEDECKDVIKGTEDHYIKGPVHSNWGFYLARICNHCTYPACVAACPRKAIYKRDEDGIVLVDQSRCRGYRECVKACPYKKPYYNNTTRVSEKCIACYPKVENSEMPQCVTTCIGKIRLQGFKSHPDKIRKNNPMDYLIHVRKIALPLYAQLGTEPNVYYIPPMHVDPKYLKQMFGPGAEKAVQMYRNAGQDKELLAALLLFGSTEKRIEAFKIKGEMTVGYDKDGKEIVSVPLTEPAIVRPAKVEQSGAYLYNNT
ncbi:MAG: dehydrogenase [Nitrospirae bacterium]|nr:dehydrogenase [Nitrospirota bacterium]